MVLEPVPAGTTRDSSWSLSEKTAIRTGVSLLTLEAVWTPEPVGAEKAAEGVPALALEFMLVAPRDGFGAAAAELAFPAGLTLPLLDAGRPLPIGAAPLAAGVQLPAGNE